jgi:hypothetical protein
MYMGRSAGWLGESLGGDAVGWVGCMVCRKDVWVRGGSADLTCGDDCEWRRIMLGLKTTYANKVIIRSLPAHS